MTLEEKVAQLNSIVPAIERLDIPNFEYHNDALRKVGNFIAVPRRNGDQLFIGAMTDTITRNLDIDLSFIGKGGHEPEAL